MKKPIKLALILAAAISCAWPAVRADPYLESLSQNNVEAIMPRDPGFNWVVECMTLARPAGAKFNNALDEAPCIAAWRVVQANDPHRAASEDARAALGKKHWGDPMPAETTHE